MLAKKEACSVSVKNSPGEGSGGKVHHPSTAVSGETKRVREEEAAVRIDLVPRELAPLRYCAGIRIGSRELGGPTLLKCQTIGMSKITVVILRFTTTRLHALADGAVEIEK